MSESITNAPQWRTGPQGTTLGKVLEVDGASVVVASAAFHRVAARLAAHGYTPRPGDSVLLTAADDGGYYVIGAVRALREASVIRAQDGASAELERDEDGQEVLRLRDPAGRVVVEHRPDEGRTVLMAPHDLELSAGGDVAISAGGAVRIAAGTDLELGGLGDVRLTASDPGGEVSSALKMRGGRTELRTERLGATLDRADVKVREANLVARTLRTVAGRVKQDVEALELTAGRIVERAKESWRETEGLSQSRAGRLRLVARESFYAIGQSAQLKAHEDVAIKGDKIHLG